MLVEERGAIGMLTEPLAAPADLELLSRFLGHFQLDPRTEPRRLLAEVSAAFSRVPYENLSKIIKFQQSGNVSAARQCPDEILIGHFRWGTGGTCFSLTAAMLYLVRSLGFRADPILADRSYGSNTHCALVVWIDDRPHLLDPGFLIVDPIPIALASEQRVTTAFNAVVLAAQQDSAKIDLFTCDKTSRRHRVTFKTDPVDSGEFLRAWDESFAWDMMHYPVLTRVVDQQQVYVRGLYQQIRRDNAVIRQQIAPDELARSITSQFGIHPQIVQEALAILQGAGDLVV